MYKVAIVGRPNIGKSTLFNRLTRTRKALVGSEPGITRDRLLEEAEWDGKRFQLIDTGGIVPDDRDTIPEKVLEQAEIAISEADLILLVMDARAGLTPLDQEVFSLIQSSGREFLLVLNKVDTPRVEDETYEFYRLGVDQYYPISAEHNLGIDDLIDEIVSRIPESGERVEEEEIRIAVIGRPNVGKSSLVNRILGEERLIVSEIAGTTRDAVDSVFRYQGQRFRLIDTAGIRRKGRTRMKAEKLSVVMARRSIKQADVVFLVLDAVEGATRLDAVIGGYAHDAGKSIIIVVNKWDLIEKDTHTAARVESEFRRRMKFLDYAPLVFVSALSGQRVFKLLEEARRAFEGSRIRIPTAELNQFLQDEVGPAMIQRDSPRKFPLKYAVQVAVGPPTIVLFLRGSTKLHFSTVRFLINQLRERYGFPATPIRILQRPSSKWKGKPKVAT